MPAYRLVEWQQPPRLVEVPVPDPGPGQVLVEVTGCGLCHSDLTMIAMPGEVGEALGWRVPFTLGHETAGRIVAVGEGHVGPDRLDRLAVGDAVALLSPTSCGACAHCRAGRDSACLASDAGRGYGRDGGLATHVLVDAVRDLLPLGALDPRHAGPLTDAGATSHHAVRRVRHALGTRDVRRGDPTSTVPFSERSEAIVRHDQAPSAEASRPDSVAVVIGIGGVGSFVVQILAAVTDARIVAVDLDPTRRDHAVALGAHATIDGGAERLGRTIRAHAAEGLDGVDAVIDVVGTDATISAGIAALRRGGAFCLVGAAGGGYPRPWMGGLPRDATVTTIQGSARADATAVIDLAAAGRIRVDVEEHPLDRVADAYAALDAGTLTGRAVVIP